MLVKILHGFYILSSIVIFSYIVTIYKCLISLKLCRFGIIWSMQIKGVTKGVVVMFKVSCFAEKKCTPLLRIAYRRVLYLAKAC